MDIFLTVGSDRLRIPLLPDKVSVRKGTSVISFSIIKTGEHKIPRGTAVTGYSWTGVFPGESMSELGFIHDWAVPKLLIDKLLNWQTRGEKIEFMISGAGLKDTVFIDNFTYDYFGKDNVSYTLSLSAFRPLTVSSAPPQPKIAIPQEVGAPSYQAQAQTGGGGSPSGSAKSTNNNNGKKTKLSVTIPTASAVSAVKASVATAVTIAATVVSTVAKTAAAVAANPFKKK